MIMINLFSETMIGGLKARNHFVRSATAEGKATAEGFPTENLQEI